MIRKKRLFGLLLLITLSLCVYGQQVINRDVAGLTLGKRYSITRVQTIIKGRYNQSSRFFRESSSTSIMAVGSIPFAGETWECLNVTQESAGRISEISFGRDFKEKDDVVSFCMRVAEMLVAKYGAPTSNHKDDRYLDWVWEDTNTTLHLQAIGKDDPAKPSITVWLSYSDELLMKKIQSDTMNEL